MKLLHIEIQLPKASVCIDKVFEFFRIYQQLERLM